jgi:hypothetical protein
MNDRTERGMQEYARRLPRTTADVDAMITSNPGGTMRLINDVLYRDTIPDPAPRDTTAVATALATALSDVLTVLAHAAETGDHTAPAELIAASNIALRLAATLRGTK